MMLFLFILMLVGVDSSDSLVENIKGQRAASILAAIGFGGLLISLIGRAVSHTDAVGLATANTDGNVQGIAQQLFTQYVWAFEVISALLIVAALGAMVLAHSERKHLSQRQLSVNRFRQSSLADTAGLPASGVYARHNAVDVPALLPDGSAAPTSISATLEARGDIIATAPFELTSQEEEEN